MAEVQVIIKMVDETAGARKGVTQSLGDIAKMAAKGGAAIAALGITMKKAFDLGKQGAAVIQTAESFDLFLQKVGAAPDLLDQLRDASRGTVADMQLMSSTMTLAAGAEDELAKALIDATPRLLEIAKAANKLNPALGDTNFQYQSLATGIKRASPLILDNLGLTVKLGEAYDIYATSLGKSSKDLTVVEQKLALLNYVSQNAGQILIDQAGSTESATDAFARLEASIKNVSDEFKTSLVPILAEAAGAFELLVTRNKRIKAALEEHEKAMREGAGTYKDYISEMLRAAVAAKKLEQGFADQIAATIEAGEFNLFHIQTLQRLGIATEDVFMAVRESSSTMDGWRTAMERAMPAAEELAEATEPTKEQLEEMKRAAEDAATAMDSMGINIRVAAGAVDTNLTGSIGRFLDQMKFFIAGGGEIQAAFQHVQQALDEGKITPEQAQEFAGELFVAAQDLERDLGEITAAEAAANIKDQLGGSLAEAKTKLDEIDEGLLSLPDKIRIQIEFVQLGSIPTVEAPGGQHGLDMIVPPGYPRDTFPVLASSGEHVKITPAGEQAGGGVTIGEVNISTGIESKVFDELVRDWMGA